MFPAYVRQYTFPSVSEFETVIASKVAIYLTNICLPEARHKKRKVSKTLVSVRVCFLAIRKDLVCLPRYFSRLTSGRLSTIAK